MELGIRNEELPSNEDELQKSYPIPISNPLKILSNPLESSRILSNSEDYWGK